MWYSSKDTKEVTRMDWKIPLFKIYWEKDDVDSIANIIKKGMFWATGPEIGEFERKISDYIGTKYCVSFNSGSSALHSVLLSHGITSGEVIVPSFTFIATANAVILAGAKPVFAETESETYGLDAEDVRKKITSKTKAIMPIHYGGLVCRDIEILKDIAEEKNILLIEDAAESLGSKLNKKMGGTFGHSAMFSFCQNKVITTGEGGVIVTDSEKVYQKLKLLRSHGRVEAENGDYFSTIKEMDYVQIGYNFRMPTMIAALGLSQLKKIDKNTEMRRENARYLTKKLSQIEGIVTPVELENQYHVYQMYTIKLKKVKHRNSLQQHLKNKKIMTKVYFEPIHLKTYYKEKFNYKKGDLPKTEELSEQVLTLPMYPTLKKQEIEYVADSIKEFFSDVKK